MSSVKIAVTILIAIVALAGCGANAPVLRGGLTYGPFVHWDHPGSNARRSCGLPAGPVVWSGGSATLKTERCSLVLREHFVRDSRPAATAIPTAPIPQPTATPTPYFFLDPPTPTSVPAPSASCNQDGSGCTQAVLSLINEARSQHGYGPLQLNATESQCALSHAQHMAQEGYISHDQFPSDICVGYQTAGENVGYSGGSTWQGLQTIHAEMMAEPGWTPGCQTSHICNILYSGYSSVGIGVYVSGGYVWLSEDFIG